LFLLLSLIDASARWRQSVSMSDNHRNINLHLTSLLYKAGFTVTDNRFENNIIFILNNIN